MRKIFTLKFHVNTYCPVNANQWKASQKEVSDDGFIAPEHCVQSIMDFARSYRVEATKSVGKVEMVLN